MTLSEILALFPEGDSNPAGNGYNVTCPSHDDKSPSLSITAGKKGIVMKCQAQCGVDRICKDLGITLKDLFFTPTSQSATKNGSNGSAKTGSWRLLGSWQYFHASGNLAYEVLKHDTPEGKQFTIRWKAPDGRWVNGSTAGEYYLVPYYDEWRRVKPKTPANYPRQTWPELTLMLYRGLEAGQAIWKKLDEVLLIVEGEKDVDRCWKEGFIAVSNTGGANRKWKAEYSKAINAKKVIIIPDDDPPTETDPKTGKVKIGLAGQKHAEEIRLSLAKLRPDIEVIVLPVFNRGLKEDISDWFDQGHTADELRKLIDSAFTQAIQNKQAASSSSIPPPPPQSPPISASGNPQPQPVKPVIDISIDDMPKLNAECWAAIEQMNQPPILFTYGSAMIRTRYDFKDKTIILDTVNADIMRHELSQFAEWRKAHNVITKPPAFLVKDVLASRSIKLPRLSRVVSVPVFGPKGTLQTQPGYDPDSEIVYAPADGYVSLPIPDVVTDSQVEAAKDLIDEMLRDFPFASNADYCNAVALFLLPFVRDMIDGPTPLHLIEASMPGSGKGLLAASLLYPGMGKIAGAPQPRDDEELRKFITSELIAMRPVIFLDNISRTIDSGAFAAALTLETWNDRILGTSATANVKIKSLWLATANNATMSTEITRRTVRLRLTPQTDRPEEREGFLHEDQIEWVMENRPQLVQAAHILCRYAIQQKLPRPKIKNVGSFERWSRLMGSIMECAGYKGFLANYRALQDGSDNERSSLALFAITCLEWREAENERLKKEGSIKEITDYLTNEEMLRIANGIDGLEFRGKDDTARAMSLGKWIKSKNEVITEWVEDDPDAEFAITRLKILSGIAGKGTKRGKTLAKFEAVERVKR